MLICISVLIILQWRIKNSDDTLKQNLKIVKRADRLLQITLNEESGTRGYLITSDQKYLDQVYAERKEFAVTANKLIDDFCFVPNTPNWSDSLVFYFNKRILHSDSMILFKKTGKTALADAMVTSLYSDKSKIFNAEIINHQNLLLANEKSKRDKTSASLQWIYFSIIFIFSGLILFFLYLLNNNFAKQKKLEAAILQSNETLGATVQERTEQISKNENRFRTLIENSGEGISIFNKEYKPIYRSAAVTRLVGWNEEELKANDIQSMVHPDDIEKFRAAMESSLAAPKMPVQLIYRSLHKNGQYIWVSKYFTSFILDGENVIVTNFRDITDQKLLENKLAESELLFRTIIETISEGITLADEHFTPFFRNPSAIKMVGELNRTGGIEMIHPDERDQIKKIHSEAIESPGKKIPFVARYQQTNGKYLHLEGEVNNLMNVPGINAIVSNYRDISKIKEAEEALKELNTTLENKVTLRTEQLQKANDAMSAFSYSVSHDLRAPLRGIIGFAKILEEEYGTIMDAEAKRIMAIISLNAKSMGELIDDLLKFSRVAKQDLVKQSCNTNLLIQKIIEELDVIRYSPEKIKWKIDSLKETFGDISTLKQVWTNLISNATKYSSNNPEPEIEIGCYAENGQTVFFIKDNGVGFDKKYADKLFKVFQRLHNSSEFEGTGIGLAIVEKIISRHEGKVWADSSVGNGACFYFSIPDS